MENTNNKFNKESDEVSLESILKEIDEEIEKFKSSSNEDDSVLHEYTRFEKSKMKIYKRGKQN